MEKDEEAEEYWKMGKNGTVEFSGKTYIKVSIMYGGGSQLDPRDSICDPTPMSELEAQQAIEDAEITDEEEDPDQPKPMPMTEEEKYVNSAKISVRIENSYDEFFLSDIFFPKLPHNRIRQTIAQSTGLGKTQEKFSKNSPPTRFSKIDFLGFFLDK